MQTYKPIFYYSVMTGNRGDMAIRKSIVDAIKQRIDVPFAFFDLKYEELTEERIEKQLNKDASALIIAGSGLYTNYPSKSSGWYFPCKTELFKKIKVPIILLGIGCNHNLTGDFCQGKLSDETKKSIQLINQISTISIVRDSIAFKLLNDLGIKHHRLELDPANFLEVPKIIKERRVAIQIAQHSKELGRFDGTSILREKNINCFTKIIKYLETKNYKIIFIAHDALEHSLIIDLLKRNPDMEFINTDNINKMLYEYTRCKFSIGIKMHSNIMSFAARTPFIGLYYDQKTIEYAKLIKHENFIHSIFDDYYDWLKLSVDKMIINSSFYQGINEVIKLYYKKDFDKTIDELCNIIKISN